MAASLYATCAEPQDVELVAYVGDDDDLQRYRAMTIEPVRWESGPPLAPIAGWNHLAETSPEAKILFQCDDDVLFRTPAWDLTVRKAFEDCPDRIMVAWPDDGKQPFGTKLFLSREWIEAVGYFMPPQFASQFCDIWVSSVAKEVGRYVRLPVLIEHLHWLWGKSENDATYQRGRSLAMAHRDEWTWENRQGAERVDAERVRQAISRKALGSSAGDSPRPESSP